jgi:hypothetical protein
MRLHDLDDGRGDEAGEPVQRIKLAHGCSVPNSSKTKTNPPLTPSQTTHTPWPL